MGRIGLTYEEVAKAATTLQAQQKTPSIDNLRTLLGTGSRSTIARHLKAWKSNQGIVNPQEGALPHELLTLVKGLWDHIQLSADERIDQASQKNQSAIDAVQQTLLLTQKEKTDLAARTHAVEETLHQRNTDMEALQQTLQTEQEEKAVQAERIDALQQRLSDQQSASEKLHKHLTQMQANLEHYQASIQELREQQSMELDQQKHSYEQTIHALRQELSALSHTHRTLEKTHYQLDTEHGIKTQSLEALSSEHSTLQQTLQKKIALTAQLQSEKAQLKEQVKQQIELSEKNNHQITALEKILAVSTAQLKQAKIDLQTHEDKIATLRHENLHLAQQKANLEGQLSSFKSAVSSEE